GGSTNGTNTGGTTGSAGVAPRQIWPPSTSVVTSRRPHLRWDSPDGDVELCADRFCNQVIGMAPGGVPDADLPPGVVFWHVIRDGIPSYTWEIFVGARGAPADHSYPGPL